MSDVVTKEDLAKLEHRIDTKIDSGVLELSGIVRGFMTQADYHFQNVDKRFDEVQQEINQLGESHNQLINTIDKFMKRLDDMAIENTARDAKLERVERWVQQVAQKTGVKLEY